MSAQKRRATSVHVGKGRSFHVQSLHRRVPLMATERSGVSAPTHSTEVISPRASGAALTPLLTIEQVAGVLCVSPKTVRRLRIPFVRLGRLVRYRSEDLNRFLAARRQHA